MSSVSNNRVLLSAFPHLPLLLMMAEHALVSRLHEIVDEDATAFLAGNSTPNMDEMHDVYPTLVDLLLEGKRINHLTPSQYCQLAADMYTYAAEKFWEDEE